MDPEYEKRLLRQQNGHLSPLCGSAEKKNENQKNILFPQSPQFMSPLSSVSNVYLF